MIAAFYFAWIVVPLIAAGIVSCCLALVRIGGSLAERYRHRRDLRRWHESCAVDDHALLTEATAIVQQAERRQP